MQLQAINSSQKVVLCGIEDVDIYEGNINGEIFTNFIARSLVPLLQPFDGKSSRSVVIVDNVFVYHMD